MEFFLFKTAAWQLMRQMDWIATLILLGLFVLSVICIAVITSKYSAFKKNRKQLNVLLGRLKHVRSLNEIIDVSKQEHDTFGGRFLMQNLGHLRHLMEGQGDKITSMQVEQLEINVNQTIDNVLLDEEMYLPVLGTSAAVAPLIGLFGTIWGLIHAFIDISQEKSADIATVAPGMAEALIVTLAGLIVAIPALIAFHYFSNELRKIEAQLSMVGDILTGAVKQGHLK